MIGGFDVKIVPPGTEITDPVTGDVVTIDNDSTVFLGSVAYMTQATWDALKSRFFDQ